MVHSAALHSIDADSIDVGNAEMDADHRVLADLIEKIGSVCGNTLAADTSCERCRHDKTALCYDALLDLGQELMLQMLAHFNREDDMMKTLPKNRATTVHCAAHRREHNEFTTRYNQALLQIDALNPVVGLRTLESFVADWVRDHILDYDLKLSEFLKNSSPASRPQA